MNKFLNPSGIKNLDLHKKIVIFFDSAVFNEDLDYLSDFYKNCKNNKEST